MTRRITTLIVAGTLAGALTWPIAGPAAGQAPVATTPAPHASPVPTLFRDVRVFDGDSVIAARDVLVADGRIVRLGRGLAAPAGATIVEGRGGTLLPGLIDAHTHVYPGALEETLIFGVTTSLDMFSDIRTTPMLRGGEGADQRADVFSAGTLVTAPGGHGTQFGVAIPTITDADSADAFVAARIAEGSDWIKIVYDDGHTFAQRWPSIDRHVLQAVIRAAHERGRLAVVHVSSADAARDALEAGADGLVHLFVDQPADDAMIRLAVEKRAFVVPTLVVLKSMTGIGGAASLVDDPRLAPYLGPQTRQMLTASFPPRQDGDAGYGHAADAAKRLHAAGVPVLAGSDAPNPGTAHGSALHRELELLVDAGLPPAAALRAATATAARSFRLDDRGRIAEGLRADLVLVDGDPTLDITATRAIRGVWKAGVRADRDAHAATVAAALERAAAAEADAPGAIERGLVSDFETGAGAGFGTEWFPSTDAMIGGSSSVTFEVVAGGAGGSSRSLRLRGSIAGGLPNAWAGVMWSPGTRPMEPVDLSAKAGVSFMARGDGRRYAVLLFAAARGMSPILRPFGTVAEWTEVRMAWSDFGVDGSDVMAVLIVATPPAGDFDLRVDDVRLY